MTKILIIDDEEKLRNLLAKIIGYEGFDVQQAGDAKSGLKKLEQHDIDVVICDVKLPDASGVELVKQLRQVNPLAEIILLTAYGNIPDSVQAIKNGAFDYITKGDDNNKIIPLLYRAVEKVALSRRVQQLEKQVGEKFSFDRVIGNSAIIQSAVSLGKKVAITETTVLLTGETGTGKEIFAQAIHQASTRAAKSFVAINCAAFSKDMLESEMFGHKSGAFTGAMKDAKGLFDEADKGTIFLDEIGEMDHDLQAKILRVIESGEFIRIGDTRPTKTDVRIISATNRDLQKEVETGKFRQDLYYRLAVFQINLPALRERIADIPLLATYFLQLSGLKMNKKMQPISADVMAILQRHDWKGNIRELRNVMERSVILSVNDELTIDLLPQDMNTSGMQQAGKQLSAFDLASAEKLHIQKVLNYTKGNKAETARLLNIAVTTLYRKLDDYKLG